MDLNINDLKNVLQLAREGVKVLNLNDSDRVVCATSILNLSNAITAQEKSASELPAKVADA